MLILVLVLFSLLNQDNEMQFDGKILPLPLCDCESCVNDWSATFHMLDSFLSSTSLVNLMNYIAFP